MRCYPHISKYKSSYHNTDTWILSMSDYLLSCFKEAFGASGTNNMLPIGQVSTCCSKADWHKKILLQDTPRETCSCKIGWKQTDPNALTGLLWYPGISLLLSRSLLTALLVWYCPLVWTYSSCLWPVQICMLSPTHSDS